MKRFGSLLLLHQPGEAWTYNSSSAILGVVITGVAKHPEDVHERTVFFVPLGMKNTGFSVPEAKIEGWLKDKYGVYWQVVPRLVATPLPKPRKGL